MAAEAAIAAACIDDDRVWRLMTIGGTNMIVAAGVPSAIGDVSRFAHADKLVSCLGLDPRVRQSGDRATQHGRISKQGRAHAHGMLVEAADKFIFLPRITGDDSGACDCRGAPRVLHWSDANGGSASSPISIDWIGRRYHWKQRPQASMSAPAARR